MVGPGSSWLYLLGVIAILSIALSGPKLGALCYTGLTPKSLCLRLLWCAARHLTRSSLTYSTSSNAHARPARTPLRSVAVFLSVAGAACAVAAPAVAQASSGPALSAAAICGKVSAGSVSRIVGFSVPAATALTNNLTPTKQNDEISAVVTSCTYGSQTNLATLNKTVGLSYEVTSRPLTTADLKEGLSQAQKLNMKLVPYSGLDLPAFYFSFTNGGVTSQGISGLAGTKEFGAFVYTKAVSKSELAALVRLAEKL